MLSRASRGGNSASCFDLDLCPDLILSAVAAFGVVAFFVLYQAITMAQRKRRKRAIQDHEYDYVQSFQYLAWRGIDFFKRPLRLNGILQ